MVGKSVGAHNVLPAITQKGLDSSVHVTLQGHYGTCGKYNLVNAVRSLAFANDGIV